MLSAIATLATLFVGLAAAFIGWQQWLVASNKLRLELFDRRYRVYVAAKNFLWAVQRRGDLDDSLLFEFNAGVSDAAFFFDSDVVGYLVELRKRAVDLQMHSKLLNPLPAGEERSRHAQAVCDQSIWLGEQFPVLEARFMPYLGFAHIKLELFPFQHRLNQAGD